MQLRDLKKRQLTTIFLTPSIAARGMTMVKLSDAVGNYSYKRIGRLLLRSLSSIAVVSINVLRRPKGLWLASIRNTQIERISLVSATSPLIGAGNNNKISYLVKLAVMSSMLLASVGCARPASVNYRVTVNVNDHGVIRQGNAVWSIRLSNSFGLDASYKPSFRGDAIPIELSSGGFLFVLPMGYGLTYSVAEMLPERLFTPQDDATDRVMQLRQVSQHIGASRTTRCNYNEVDTERFAADPRGPNADCLSVAFLKKHGGKHDLRTVPLGGLAKITGSGVTIRSVDITITNNAPESNIQKLVPWIDSIPDSRHGYDTRFPKIYDVSPEAFFLRR